MRQSIPPDGGAGAGPLVAAIDQGTTGTRCILFDGAGRQRASAYEEHVQLTPQPGWVEHDPEEIWEKTAGVIRKALAQAGLAGNAAGRIAALRVAHQRQATVPW